MQIGYDMKPAMKTGKPALTHRQIEVFRSLMATPHVTRAAEESIAYQLRDVIDMMKQDSGVALARVQADGGATGDKFLMQFIADITGVEVIVSNVSECSPLGAALLGGLGVGLFASVEQLASLPRETVSFRRLMPDADVAKNYAGWKQAVQRVL